MVPMVLFTWYDCSIISFMRNRILLVFLETQEWSIMFCIVCVPLNYINICIILWHITVMSHGNVFGFVFCCPILCAVLYCPWAFLKFEPMAAIFSDYSLMSIIVAGAVSLL